jgi:large subunit ribosomal protein L17
VAHRIGGRKLSRKQGPRLALYKNLTVSVLRYERVQTTEAKAKEIRGFVDRMITLAKQNDLAARRAVVAQLPNEPLVVSKLFDEIAPKYADRTSGYTRIVRSAHGEAMPRRSSRSNSSRSSRGGPCALPRTGRIRRHGLCRLPGAAWSSHGPG